MNVITITIYYINIIIITIYYINVIIIVINDILHNCALCSTIL